MTNVFYVDGRYVEQGQATLPVTDLAVVRGYGVFDFMRTYGGKPFMAAAHIARLRRSASLIDLPVPWTDEEIMAIVSETLARNPHPEANVRIIVTGGDSPNFLLPDDAPRLLVMVTPVLPIPQAYYDHGVKVITERTQRYQPDAKTINYIAAIRAMKRAKAADAAEAIYLSADGLALEGTTTNLFAFYGDTLVTPYHGILRGITRGVVLEMARPHFAIEERDLPLSELLTADEVFITASNKQVMPVVQVDDHRIAGGQVGERTRRIMSLYKDYTHALAWA